MALRKCATLPLIPKFSKIFFANLSLSVLPQTSHDSESTLARLTLGSTVGGGCGAAERLSSATMTPSTTNLRKEAGSSSYTLFMQVLLLHYQLVEIKNNTCAKHDAKARTRQQHEGHIHLSVETLAASPRVTLELVLCFEQLVDVAPRIASDTALAMQAFASRDLNSFVNSN